MILNIWLLVGLFCLSSCEKEDLSFTSGDIEMDIEPGKNWLHDYPLFLGLNKKNAPQFAIWLEDTTGKYLTTVFATFKIATEGWIANHGNRRKEALPHWCYQRGHIYEDGLLLPTKDHPLTDGITGATPQKGKTIQVSLVHLKAPFVVKAEFNHSIDFNDYYHREAKEGDGNYSGGKDGSGQPAVVYSATVYADTRKTELELIGHSSPDGTNGSVYENMDSLTSAKEIVKSITLIIK